MCVIYVKHFCYQFQSTAYSFYDLTTMNGKVCIPIHMGSPSRAPWSMPHTHITPFWVTLELVRIANVYLQEVLIKKKKNQPLGKGSYKFNYLGEISPGAPLLG